MDSKQNQDPGRRTSQQDQRPGLQPDQQQQQDHSSTSWTGTPPGGATLNSTSTDTTSAVASQSAPPIVPAAPSGNMSAAVPPPEGHSPASNLIAVPASYPPPQGPPPPREPTPALNPPTGTRPSPSPAPSSVTVPSESANVSTTTEQKEYWCHKCQREITPIMIPDPICPHCHNDFVEEIEANNDPRAFVQPAEAPRSSSGQYPGTLSSGDHHIPGAPEPHEPVNLEDLFRLFQVVSNPQRMAQHQYQQRQHQQSPFGGQGQRSGSSQSFVFSSGPSGFTRTVTTTLGPDGRVQSNSSGSGFGVDSAHAGGEDQGQWHEPPAFISGLLNRLGIHLSYTTDPRALQSFGIPMGGGGGLFPMVGNPGDYAWGRGGLDDIISQMMELQNRQHGPVGATDELINNIPHHTLSDAELADKTECSVCKDEFTKEDTLLQLPCKHIFHDACITPWLKVSGTCPTCRYSLIEGHPATTDATGNTNTGAHSSANASAATGATGATSPLPGLFTTAAPGDSASTTGVISSQPSLPPHEPLD